MKVPISVIIPCYNSERFIREAIQSVKSQSFSVDEIIVVDNNCTDKTVEIAEEMGAIIVKQPKQGLAGTRNKGISIAKNEWMATLDSDDIWAKDKIEYQWKAIDMFPAARLVSCWFNRLDSNGEFDQIIEIKGDKDIEIKPVEFDNRQTIIGETFSYTHKITADLFRWFVINASTALIHREVFEKVGVFDESLAFREEIEFFMRALSISPIATVTKKLVNIRLHSDSMGHNRKGLHEGHGFIAKRMLRFPDNYAIGAGEFHRNSVIATFLRSKIGLSRALKFSQKTISSDLINE